MRKRRMVGAACGAVLVVLALAGSMPAGAAAQSAETPWLGVTTQEITSDLREGLDYRGSGVLVNRVVSDSPAARAGLRKGDVIVSFNSRTVDSPETLVELVRSARVGQAVSVTVVRDGTRRSLTARLVAWPEDSEDLFEAPPTPPRAPQAPRAPSAPRTYSFEWNGEDFELPGDGYFTLLRGMGRGRLGIQIQDLNTDLAEALGVPGGKGVLVTEVLDDTPASKAGIKAGDVVTEVADRAIDDVNDLHRELGNHEGRVKVTVMRRGVRRTVEPELEAKPEVTRLRRGGNPMVLRIPDIRRRVIRDRAEDEASRSDLEQQLRELRQELRELRKKVEGTEKN